MDLLEDVLVDFGFLDRLKHKRPAVCWSDQLPNRNLLVKPYRAGPEHPSMVNSSMAGRSHFDWATGACEYGREPVSQ
jgi:hypothetical protein